MQEVLIFQVRHILAILENNPSKFLHVNKVQLLSFQMISVSILH